MKRSKESVHYENPATMDHRCRDCRHAYVDDYRDATLVCSLVRGQIALKAWCELWERRL